MPDMVALLLLRRKAVAASAYCLNHTVVPCLLQNCTQAANMDIDRSFLDKNMVAPHLIEQLSTAIYPLGVRHEK